MNKLTLKVAALVPLLYTGWATADELPQTAEYGTTYDSEGTTGEVRFVAPYDMEIVAAEPGCGCTGVEFPQGQLKAGETYSIAYQIDTKGRSGTFTPSIDFSVAGQADKWQLQLEGQVVPILPSKLHLETIQGDDLSSINRRIPLAQINAQPRHISRVQVVGKGIEASVVDGGTALEITPAASLTWGDRIIATIEATIAAEGAEYSRSINVRGRVSPRFSLEPQSASFGVGAAQRRETRQVRVGLPAELADAPVQASPVCGEVQLDIAYQRKADNSLVVQIRNTSNFPAGTLNCGVEVQIGAEQVLIPVLALTR
ncbi:MAG: DUF1573 domain-containing protein [Gemmatimonadetes bacterium]|nr:DUF1573 domain-containing protein [Gemmatimonadota bacterium]